MKRWRYMKWLKIVAPGAMLFGFLGCLGPNPGFFIGSSVANATINTIVGTLLGRAIANVLNLFGL